jgi:glycosyltransferase involved in cell wall biosynthesis
VFLSVVIPTHKPNKARLGRALAALDRQSLSPEKREIILIDNRSDPPLNRSNLSTNSTSTVRIVREEQLGLTPARIRGIREAKGDVIVFVDDDNLLADNYLSIVATRFADNRKLGAAGGKSLPEFETQPPAWTKEFWQMLALRDLGSESLCANSAATYPACAPLGAGMAVRRDVALAWSTEIENDPARMALDRSGRSLASGGDNDLVLTILKQGFEVEYTPDLVLTHLIPHGRTTPKYLARLNYASSRTWAHVLRIHQISPWHPLSRFGSIIRKVRSFFSMRAWKGAPEHIRWRGACGIFDGRVGNYANTHAQS